MSTHIEIAKRFVGKLLTQRTDIVGVLLVGSAARGDETAFSDIDLRVIVTSKEGNWLFRDGSDGWFEGVYVDTGIVVRELYADVRQVLTNPTAANDMNDALILYDPEEFLAEVQQSVRAVFMQPQWVGRRVKMPIERFPPLIIALRTAVTGNAPDICINASRIFFGLASVPLFVYGISLSSTRNLAQLGEVALDWKNRICELEGTSALTDCETAAAIAILAKLTDLIETDRWGDVPQYVVKKVEWMAQNGYPQAALHTAWFNNGFRIRDCLDGGKPAVIAQATALTEEWLMMMGWESKGSFSGKLDTISAMTAELEEMTATYIAAIQH